MGKVSLETLHRDNLRAKCGTEKEREMPQQNITDEWEDGWRHGMTQCAEYARGYAETADLSHDGKQALLDFCAKVEKIIADKLDVTKPGHEVPLESK
jgi:hypothetical protein